MDDVLGVGLGVGVGVVWVKMCLVSMGVVFVIRVVANCSFRGLYSVR